MPTTFFRCSARQRFHRLTLATCSLALFFFNKKRPASHGQDAWYFLLRSFVTVSSPISSFSPQEHRPAMGKRASRLTILPSVAGATCRRTSSARKQLEVSNHCARCTRSLLLARRTHWLCLALLLLTSAIASVCHFFSLSSKEDVATLTLMS